MYMYIGFINFQQQNHNDETLGSIKGLEGQSIIVLGLNVPFKTETNHNKCLSYAYDKGAVVGEEGNRKIY